jgi:hypothetical protein
MAGIDTDRRRRLSKLGLRSHRRRIGQTVLACVLGPDETLHEEQDGVGFHGPCAVVWDEVGGWRHMTVQEFDRQFEGGEVMMGRLGRYLRSVLGLVSAWEVRQLSERVALLEELAARSVAPAAGPRQRWATLLRPRWDGAPTNPGGTT